MPHFIRGLWGDKLVERLPATRATIEVCTKRYRQPEPLAVYCYGRENAEFLRSQGYEAVMMSDRAVENFLGRRHRDVGFRGTVNWGGILWLHKMAIILRACREHGEIVWLDWDVNQIRALPNDFWEARRAGPSVQTPLVQYHQRQCTWRSRDPRKVCWGAWIYVRGAGHARRLWRLQRQNPTIVDQVVLSLYTDRLAGGWRDRDHYRAAGFDPGIIKGQRSIFGPPRPIFKSKPIKMSKLKKSGHEDLRKYKTSTERPPGSPNRTLVYGMQSSGASYVTWCLAQDPNTVAVIDLHNPRPVPLAEEFAPEQTVVLKATVNPDRPLRHAVARFRPGRVILIVRDEEAVRASMERRQRTTRRPRVWGRIDEKLAVMRQILEQKWIYDEVIRYEDFVREPRRLSRTLEDIIRYNHGHSEWCRQNRPQRWGIGAIRLPDKSLAEMARLARLVRRGESPGALPPPGGVAAGFDLTEKPEGAK